MNYLLDSDEAPKVKKSRQKKEKKREVTYVSDSGKYFYCVCVCMYECINIYLRFVVHLKKITLWLNKIINKPIEMKQYVKKTIINYTIN